MFSLVILGSTGLDAGPELFSGQAALTGVILGLAVFLFFLLVNALTYVGMRKKVVIPYLSRIIGERALPLLLLAIVGFLLAAMYLMLILWPPSLAG
ncbi:MAG TPA: hypothetical protein VEL81_03925 [Thermoplasmata archaeon]|nr:hypothetical protein [Thermoplasmata archaeon]